MNPLRIITWPARTAYNVVDEGIWLARMAVEVFGYGISIGGPPADEPDWAHLPGLSNERLDCEWCEGDPELCDGMECEK